MTVYLLWWEDWLVGIYSGQTKIEEKIEEMAQDYEQPEEFRRSLYVQKWEVDTQIKEGY